jgi:hypothetical protein
MKTDTALLYLRIPSLQQSRRQVSQFHAGRMFIGLTACRTQVPVTPLSVNLLLHFADRQSIYK